MLTLLQFAMSLVLAAIIKELVSLKVVVLCLLVTFVQINLNHAWET